MDYEKDLAIDPNDLAEEWLRQPMLYMQYADRLAEAQAERDKAKEKVDVVRAELDKKIRENPDLYEIKKITEAVVANAILLQEGYQKAQAQVRDATLNMNMINAAVKAFEHRKKALENLVQLYQAKWFAGPKEPKDLPPGKRIRDIAHDAATKKQRSTINRRKKSPREGGKK